MEARLPDLNSRWMKYNHSFYRALDFKQVEICKSYLWSMNDMLPPKYRIIEDTDQYNEKVHSEIYAFCKECKEESKWPSVEKFHVKLTGMDIIANNGRIFADCWKCPKCEHVEWNSRTEMSNETPHESQIFGIVPDPPVYTYADTRNKFFYKFRKWALRFQREIDSALGNLRNDYVSTMGETKMPV